MVASPFREMIPKRQIPSAVDATRARAEVEALIPPGRTSFYPHEIAAIISVTRHHVMDLIREGDLAAVAIGTGRGKNYKISVDSLRQFLLSHYTGTAAT